MKAGNDASILVIFKRIERFITILTSKEFFYLENLEIADMESKVSEHGIQDNENKEQQEFEIESNFSMNLLRHDTGLYTFI